jgi:hypothetical protein
MQLFRKFFLNKPALVESEVPVLELTFAQLPTLPLAQIVPREKLERWYPGHYNLAVEQDRPAGDMYLATVSFGEHAADIAGIANPLPPIVLERCLLPSHWDASFHRQARGMGAHVIISYSGASKDPIEQYMALYAVAAQWVPHGAFALFNEPAWTCHPAHFAQALTQPDMQQVCRESPPLIFWTGFLKLDASQSISGDQSTALWFLSRGNHLFGVPDFALQSNYVQDAAIAQELFSEIFQYFYFDNRDIQPGDFLQVEQRGIFEFMDGAELRDIFGGMGSILIVRPSNRQEIEALQA